MGIESHGGTVRFESGGGVSGDQGVIAPEMIAVVGVVRIEAGSALQAGKLWSFGEGGCNEQTSGEKQVNYADDGCGGDSDPLAQGRVEGKLHNFLTEIETTTAKQ